MIDQPIKLTMERADGPIDMATRNLFQPADVPLRRTLKELKDWIAGAFRYDSLLEVESLERNRVYFRELLNLRVHDLLAEFDQCIDCLVIKARQNEERARKTCEEWPVPVE